MKYGNAQTTVNLDFELCGKKALVRLDKYLQDFHNMKSTEEREPILKEAKRAAIVKELAKLRAAGPDVPMASSLDMCNTTEHDYNAFPICQEQFEGGVDIEQEGLTLQDEDENDLLYPKLKKTADFSSGVCPPSGNSLMTRGSTPIAERNQSSSDSFQCTSQPLPSTPVPGSHNSSSCLLEQHPFTSLPDSTNPPSCERSVSKVCSCNSRWEDFKSRLQLLEQKVVQIITVQPQTTKGIPRNPPLSAQTWRPPRLTCLLAPLLNVRFSYNCHALLTYNRQALLDIANLSNNIKFTDFTDFIPAATHCSPSESPPPPPGRPQSTGPE
ncbi:uncharacterized protein LOC113166804 [Anabas testudineus]|uniref:uncharacterized protein LOC113166804 n=1 Tax=Anabas testudineus TaxID=64144 RepID=UPI000E45E617|nr:uncharacterized protein LOC113166804 [Anabas testudineus]